MNYEQKYKEALERAKQELDACGSLNCDAARQIFRLFPELQSIKNEKIKNNIIKLLRFVRDTYHQYSDECNEAIAWLEKQGNINPTEDERIRKELINFFKNHMDSVYEEISDNNVVIAWLEKQGEHANFRNKIQVGDEVTRNEDGVLVNLSQLNRVAKKDEKQGKQKPIDKVEPKFKVGSQEYPLTPSECFKPAWSEEDEKIYQSIIDDTVQENQLDDKQINWLKSIKDRVQLKPKQEWNEEDEHCIELLLPIIDSSSLIPKNRKKCKGFLKSLKPNHWKPSEEQMNILKSAIGYTRPTEIVEILQSLYNDLKKL